MTFHLQFLNYDLHLVNLLNDLYLIPVFTLSKDGVLSVTNGVDTDFTINNISVESQFLYKEGTSGNADEYKTVPELTLKVAELEARIAELENPTKA